jgi:ComF family protein
LIDLFSKLAWKVDLIVPLPISKGHLLQRGFNQTDLFAYPLSLSLGIPYQNKALKRIRETRSQVGLNAKERSENVSGAFKAETSHVMGKVVLVLDDVATTGSSISACANALKDAGAKRVYGLTLARPILKESQITPIDV